MTAQRRSHPSPSPKTTEWYIGLFCCVSLVYDSNSVWVRLTRTEEAALTRFRAEESVEQMTREIAAHRMYHDAMYDWLDAITEVEKAVPKLVALACLGVRVPQLPRFAAADAATRARVLARFLPKGPYAITTTESGTDWLFSWTTPVDKQPNSV